MDEKPDNEGGRFGTTAGEVFKVRHGAGGQVRLTVRTAGTEINVDMPPLVAAWLGNQLDPRAARNAGRA